MQYSNSRGDGAKMAGKVFAMTNGEDAGEVVKSLVDEAATALPFIKPREQKMIDNARDNWLMSEATAFGYRQNVKRLEQLQQWLDGLSVLVAIWLVAILWGVQELVPSGVYQQELKTIVSVVGTLLSLTVVSLVLVSWRSEWRGASERHRTLADKSARLGDRYRDIFQAEVFDETKYRKAEEEKRTFESEQSQPLGVLPDWCIPKGFEHAARKHPDQNVRCNSCMRSWENLRAVPWWRLRIIYGKCKNCGFVK